MTKFSTVIRVVLHRTPIVSGCYCRLFMFICLVMYEAMFSCYYMLFKLNNNISCIYVWLCMKLYSVDKTGCVRSYIQLIRLAVLEVIFS